MKKRHTAKPAPLVMAGMHIVPILHAIIMDGRSQRGSALANEVSDVECRDASVPERVVHVQILLQAGEACIGYVDAVKVAGQN
jgi:hypothetical protein